MNVDRNKDKNISIDAGIDVGTANIDKNEDVGSNSSGAAINEIGENTGK